MEKKTGQDMSGEQMTPEDTRYWLSYAEKFPRVLRDMSPMEIKGFVEAVVEHHARHEERQPMAQTTDGRTWTEAMKAREDYRKARAADQAAGRAKFQQEEEEREREDSETFGAQWAEALRRRHGEKSGE